MRIILIFSAILLFACKSNKENPEVQELYNEVIAVHDEIMPETSTIHRLKKTLQNDMGNDSITTIIIHELDAADEAMMEWMADFGGYSAISDEDEAVKMDYLQNELNEIKEVRQRMIDAIDKAKKHLDENLD